jgi:hypothetical protein
VHDVRVGLRSGLVLWMHEDCPAWPAGLYEGLLAQLGKFPWTGYSVMSGMRPGDSSTPAAITCDLCRNELIAWFRSIWHLVPCHVRAHGLTWPSAHLPAMSAE